MRRRARAADRRARKARCDRRRRGGQAQLPSCAPAPPPARRDLCAQLEVEYQSLWNHGVCESIDVGGSEQPRLTMLDQACGPAAVDRDHRQPACLRFEHHLTERLGGAREQERVGAGVGAREGVSGQPSEERRVLAEPGAEQLLLRAAARERQVQARIAAASFEERVGEEVDSLLAAQSSGIQQVDLARQQMLVTVGGVEALQVDAAIPAPDPLGRDPQLAQAIVTGPARRQHDVTCPVEHARAPSWPSISTSACPVRSAA